MCKARDRVFPQPRKKELKETRRDAVGSARRAIRSRKSRPRDQKAKNLASVEECNRMMCELHRKGTEFKLSALGIVVKKLQILHDEASKIEEGLKADGSEGNEFVDVTQARSEAHKGQGDWIYGGWRKDGKDEKGNDKYVVENGKMVWKFDEEGKKNIREEIEEHFKIFFCLRSAGAGHWSELHTAIEQADVKEVEMIMKRAMEMMHDDVSLDVESLFTQKCDVRCLYAIRDEKSGNNKWVGPAWVGRGGDLDRLSEAVKEEHEEDLTHSFKPGVAAKYKFDHAATLTNLKMAQDIRTVLRRFGAEGYNELMINVSLGLEEKVRTDLEEKAGHKTLRRDIASISDDGKTALKLAENAFPEIEKLLWEAGAGGWTQVM